MRSRSARIHQLVSEPFVPLPQSSADHNYQYGYGYRPQQVAASDLEIYRQQQQHSDPQIYHHQVKVLDTHQWQHHHHSQEDQRQQHSGHLIHQEFHRNHQVQDFHQQQFRNHQHSQLDPWSLCSQVDPHNRAVNFNSSEWNPSEPTTLSPTRSKFTPSRSEIQNRDLHQIHHIERQDLYKNFRSGDLLEKPPVSVAEEIAQPKTMRESSAPSPLHLPSKDNGGGCENSVSDIEQLNHQYHVQEDQISNSQVQSPIIISTQKSLEQFIKHVAGDLIPGSVWAKWQHQQGGLCLQQNKGANDCKLSFFPMKLLPRPKPPPRPPPKPPWLATESSTCRRIMKIMAYIYGFQKKGLMLQRPKIEYVADLFSTEEEEEEKRSVTFPQTLGGHNELDASISRKGDEEREDCGSTAATQGSRLAAIKEEKTHHQEKTQALKSIKSSPLRQRLQLRLAAATTSYGGRRLAVATVEKEPLKDLVEELMRVGEGSPTIDLESRSISRRMELMEAIFSLPLISPNLHIASMRERTGEWE